MKVHTISINLLGPVTMNMSVYSVKSGHVDGNLVVLKNDLYKIPFVDKTTSWKEGDQVEVQILNPINSPLQIPIEIKKVE